MSDAANAWATARIDQNKAHLNAAVAIAKTFAREAYERGEVVDKDTDWVASILASWRGLDRQQMDELLLLAVTRIATGQIVAEESKRELKARLQALQEAQHEHG